MVIDKGRLLKKNVIKWEKFSNVGPAWQERMRRRSVTNILILKKIQDINFKKRRHILRGSWGKSLLADSDCTAVTAEEEERCCAPAENSRCSALTPNLT